MSRTYVKGRISKDKRRGFKRTKSFHICYCQVCNSRRKGLKKTKEREDIKSLLSEYYQEMCNLKF